MADACLGLNAVIRAFLSDDFSAALNGHRSAKSAANVGF